MMIEKLEYEFYSKIYDNRIKRPPEYKDVPVTMEEIAMALKWHKGKINEIIKKVNNRQDSNKSIKTKQKGRK